MKFSKFEFGNTKSGKVDQKETLIIKSKIKQTGKHKQLILNFRLINFNDFYNLQNQHFYETTRSFSLADQQGNFILLLLDRLKGPANRLCKLFYAINS